MILSTAPFFHQSLTLSTLHRLGRVPCSLSFLFSLFLKPAQGFNLLLFRCGLSHRRQGLFCLRYIDRAIVANSCRHHSKGSANG